ncbi:MAG: hypothetical protein OQK05_03045 [Pseudopelagicola sp.]|nr:hypothetical protein [Pseudopelagicola sp.]
MTVWNTLSLAHRLTSGSRRAEIAALLAYRDKGVARPEIVVATPPRFLSLRKLIKPNTAIDAMLRIMHTTFAQAQMRGLGSDLRLSHRPLQDPAPKLWLSHHTIRTPAYDALTQKGVMVRHFKAADIPDHTVVDPLGFSGWSSLADADINDLDLSGVSQHQIDTFFEETRARTIAGNLSKYTQTSQAEELPEPYVFVALQTIDDMVQRNAHIPMLDMLSMIVAFFHDSGMHVVVKRHPKCRNHRVSRALKKAATAPHVTLTNGSIHEIMSGAAALFTVNSGVGAESIIHNVPVYCFGKADYMAVAHQIRTAEDLERTAKPLRSACSDDARKRFLYYYRNVYQIRHDHTLGPRLGQLIDAACA